MFHMFSISARRNAKFSIKGPRTRQRRLRVEPLEQRRLLSTVRWIGRHSDDWQDWQNWDSGQVPVANDTARFDAWAQGDTLLTADATVGKIQADHGSGSDREINLNGHALTTVQAIGIDVADTSQSPSALVGAELGIVNSGANKTLTTGHVYVGVNGHTFQSGPPNHAKLSLSSANLVVQSSGNLRVGGRNQGTMLLNGANVTVGEVSLGGGAANPSQTYTIAEMTVSNSATLTVNGDITVGNDNFAGAQANNSNLVSKLTIGSGAQVSVASTKEVMVGRYHPGELTIAGGATLSGQGSGFDMTVGNGNALPGSLHEWMGKGTLKVDGLYSLLEVRDLGVGHSLSSGLSWAPGTVEITDGGLLHVHHDVEVGDFGQHESPSWSTIDVDRSNLNVDRHITVGSYGKVTVGGVSAVISVSGEVETEAGRKGNNDVNGTIVVEPDGTFTVRGRILNRGTLQCYKDGKVVTIEEPLINSGAIIPGSSPGEFTLDGDFEQVGPGVLEIEIGGTTPVTQYDVMTINDSNEDDYGGNAALGGMLQVSLIDAFTPQLGNQFTVLTTPYPAGSLTGEFDYVDVSQAPLGAGLAWKIDYDRYDEDSDGLLEVTLTVVEEDDTDIVFERFYTDGYQFWVEYEILGTNSVDEFDIGIFSSADKSTVDVPLIDSMTPSLHVVTHVSAVGRAVRGKQVFPGVTSSCHPRWIYWQSA